MELLISLIIVLFFEVNFHKEIIDDMIGNVEEQDEWHKAAVWFRIAIYGAIAFPYLCFISLVKYLGYLALFVSAFPILFDFFLNLRRKLSPLHSNPRYDMGWITKLLLLISGIFTFIGLKGLS